MMVHLCKLVKMFIKKANQNINTWVFIYIIQLKLDKWISVQISIL